MTIDIDLLRTARGGDPEKVRESEKRRFRSPGLVDEVIDLDAQWVKQDFQSNEARRNANQIQKTIDSRKKSDRNDACADLTAAKVQAVAAADEAQRAAKELFEKRNEKLAQIGNILHDSVPVSQDEEKDNEVVQTWGTIPTFMAPYQTNGFRPHFELLEMIGAVEFDAGHDIAGNRAYFLTGPGVLLNQALLNYGLAFCMKYGFTPVQPPFMMNRGIMAQAAELKDYDEVLYKVVETADNQELDKYLIATSEQPLTAFHRNQTLYKTDLPKKYVGISSCFRREAGSSGRDIRGIFRVHQFEKIEQFCVTEAEKSWEMHEQMIDQAAAFYQTLEIPYHVVAIVSGEMNDAAAKKYDLEAWFPGDKGGSGQYRELVSCSNCTDYQSRKMNTKYFSETNKHVYPHMLNSTLCATERAMCCLVENYQTAEGIRVPRVLVPFMLGQEFIPFVKAPPKEKAEKKKKGK